MGLVGKYFLAGPLVPGVRIIQQDSGFRLFRGRRLCGDAGNAEGTDKNDPFNARHRELVHGPLQRPHVHFCRAARRVPDLAEVVHDIHAFHGIEERRRIAQVSMKKRYPFTLEPGRKFPLS